MLKTIMEFAMAHPFISLGVVAFFVWFLFFMDFGALTRKLSSGSSCGRAQGYGGDDLPDRTSYDDDLLSESYHDLLGRTGNTPADGVYTSEGINYTAMSEQAESMKGEIVPEK